MQRYKIIRSDEIMARINNINKYKQTELNNDSILLGSKSPNGETVNYNVVDVALFVAGYIGDIEAGIQSIQAGNNITIDNTDPQNPIISSTGELQGLQSVLNEGNLITLPAREGSINGIHMTVTPESFEESKSEWLFPYAVVSKGGTKGGQFSIQVNDDGYIGIATSIGTNDDNTHVSNNLYYGGLALNSLTRAAVSNGSNYNTAVGSQSLRFLIDGSRNTAIGSYAGRGISTGSRNITVGSHALYDPRDGFTTTASTVIGNVRGINENLVNSIVLSDGRDVSGTSGVGFWVKQNGLTLIPRQTNTNIDNDTTGKAVITKEYFDANSGGTTEWSQADW